MKWYPTLDDLMRLHDYRPWSTSLKMSLPSTTWWQRSHSLSANHNDSTIPYLDNTANSFLGANWAVYTGGNGGSCVGGVCALKGFVHPWNSHVCAQTHHTHTHHSTDTPQHTTHTPHTQHRHTTPHTHTHHTTPQHRHTTALHCTNTPMVVLMLWN